jgi:hypothetical protein
MYDIELRNKAEAILRRHGDGLPWERGRGRDTWMAAIYAIEEALITMPKPLVYSKDVICEALGDSMADFLKETSGTLGPDHQLDY